MTAHPPGVELIRRLRVMGRLVRRMTKRPGTAPGTPVHTGRRRVEQLHLHRITYDEGSIDERHADAVDPVFPFETGPVRTWLNVDGLHDVELLRDLASRIGLHPLALEDVVSIGQRPKAEEYDHQLYIVVRMLAYDDATKELTEEQISIVLGEGYVVSFQEDVGDVWDPVRERLRSGRTTIRRLGADYLAYSLIDAIVDGYFAVLEKLGDRMESLENTMLEEARRDTIAEVHHIKRELLLMRRAVWPARDLLNSLIRDGSPLIADGTRVFLRDAYDHAVQVIDTVETLRDLASGIIDLYLSTASNRMNEVMKVLTVIATTFIPVTFLAGVWGMNFQYMPELRQPWAYPAVLLLMGATIVALLFWFRRKGWF